MRGRPSRSRPTLDVVFLLAGSAARRAALLPSARAALAGADFDVLARELADRRLLPLIGSRAVEAGGDLVPDTFREAVTRARAAARAHGLAVEAATNRIAGLLAADDIRALPLKGPLLAQAAHGDLGLRQTADIDLLVPAERIDAAVGLLREHGYSQPEDKRRANGLPDLHFELHHDTMPPVELHWRAYWYESAFSARLLADAAPGPDGLLRAQPADLIATLLLIHARDGFHGVRAASDIAAWHDRNGADLPERFLEPYAERYPELRPGLTASAIAVERLTGVPAVSWLGDGALHSRRVSLATRLADWSQSADRDQMAANITLVGALLCPPGAAPELMLRELVLPRRGPLASAVHTAKVGVRSAMALWRVRGSRPWVEPPVSAGAR